MRNFTTGCWMFLWSCFCVAQAPIDTTEASVLLQRARMEYESQSIEAAFKSVTLAQQLFTKTLGENHPRVADCIYIQAMCYFMQDELRKALQLAQQAYKLHQKSKESPLTLAKDIDLIGHIQLYQGDDVGAEQQFDIAYNIRKKHLAPDDKIMTRSLDKYFLLNMYRRREDKGIDILLQIMAIDKKHYAPDDVKLALTYADLGEAYKAIGNFRNANKYYQMAVPIFEKAKSPHLATVKNNIGTLYLKQCDMHQALLYFLDALAMDIMKYGAYSYETSLGYRNLGDYYLSKGDYYAALEMYNEVQCIRSTHSDLDPLTLAPVLEDISTCWLELGDKQTAWEYLKQASKIKKQHLPPIDIRMSDNYGSLGDWYYKQHQYTTAQQNYQKAVSIREKLESVNPIDVATLNQKIAECYLHLSNPLQALRIVRSEYQKMNISENTPIEELPKLETAILLLSTQATALRRRYEQLHIIDTLQAAEATLKTAIVLIEKLRNSYRNGESINLLSDYFQKIYDEALQTNMELFYYTQVEKYLLYAFALADANRSAALANAVQRNIIQDESAADIQQRCLYYERKIAEATPAQKRIFEDSLRHYQQQYYAATKNLKTDFTLKPPDLPQMQKQLKKEGAAVITYAMTDDSLYIFVLTGNKLYHHTQQLLSSLQKDVQTFNQSILEYAMHLHTSSEYLTYFDNVYTQTAQQLYKYLVQPIEQYLPERVCIVPTGVLGYVAFDALLTAPPAKAQQFQDYPYWLKKHTISYSYSVQLMTNKHAPLHHAKHELLAVAPTFASTNNTYTAVAIATRQNFEPLKYNVEEIQRVREQIGSGDLLLDNSATVKKFEDIAAQYRILHLSTHAKADERKGDFSYLAFQNTSDNRSNLLYAKDLYGLRLNADLVVLSACETANGELRRNEGIISLGYGFLHTGAKSLITTLWNINDATTPVLIEYFYQGLLAHQDKATALNRAKKRYIQADKEQALSHPFFWAAFMPVGDMQPLAMQSTTTNRMLWWILVAVVLGGLYFLWRRFFSSWH